MASLPSIQDEVRILTPNAMLGYGMFALKPSDIRRCSLFARIHFRAFLVRSEAIQAPCHNRRLWFHGRRSLQARDRQDDMFARVVRAGFGQHAGWSVRLG